MTDYFAMVPGQGNLPDLVAEIAARSDEAAKQLKGRGGSAITAGDSDPIWDALGAVQESLGSMGADFGNFSDAWGNAAGNLGTSQGV